jgi:integrase
MAKVKFTAGRVDGFQCESGKSASFLWDSVAPGLGLRAASSGGKSYIFQAKLSGQVIRVTIGAPGTWAIDAAQAEARRLKVIIDNGQDPRHVKADKLDAEQATRDAKQAAAAALQTRQIRESVTLGEVWKVYLESRKPKWGERHYLDHVELASIGGEDKKRGKGKTSPGPLASLMPLPLTELTGKRLGEWLAVEKVKRSTRAALAYRLLSVFVNWCDSQADLAGLVPSGACRSQQVKDEIPSKNTKEGDCLQREQLGAWFDAVRKMGNPVQSAYLQALLLTGARRRELAALCWADIDFQWKSVIIRDKVEGERVIPLTPYVAQLLTALPRRSEWVFSSPSAANGQLTEPTPGHKRALAAAGLPDLTLHGLRRSFGTLCEWVEVPSGISAQIMGHKPSAIAEKHYRRRSLDLLRKWHVQCEAWILNEAKIDFMPAEPGLHVVTR